MKNDGNKDLSLSPALVKKRGFRPQHVDAEAKKRYFYVQ